MDCRTAQLLIEAFHDDELGVVEAATLLAHLEGCPPCGRRNEAARRLKSIFRETRPVVECPEAIKRRLARRVDGSRKFPRAVPPSLMLFVLAAGLGVLVGEAVPLREGVVPSQALAFAGTPVTERVSGDLFCLRCALQKLFPGTSLRATPHRPVLRTSDGRIFTIFPDALGARLGKDCAERHVDVLARLYPGSGIASVVSVRAAAQEPTPAGPALTLARR